MSNKVKACTETYGVMKTYTLHLQNSVFKNLFFPTRPENIFLTFELESSHCYDETTKSDAKIIGQAWKLFTFCISE